MSTSLIKVPAGGQKIVPGQPTPDNPIIPYIEGDGIGVDITPVMIQVIDAAVTKAYGGLRKIHWMEVYAGEKSTQLYGPMNGSRRRPSTPSRNSPSPSRAP